MVFRRKSRRKMVRRRRRPNPRRRVSFKQKVLKVLKVETKIHDRFDNGRLIYAAQNWITRFHEIAQGTAQDERVGKKIDVISLSGSFFVTADAATVVGDLVRIAVWMTRETDEGTLPSVDDIYENEFSPCSFREKDATGVFRLLWGRRFILGGADRPKTRCLAMNWKGSIPVRFAGSGTQSINKNLIFVTAQTNASVGQPVIMSTILMRTRYTDL